MEDSGYSPFFDDQGEVLQVGQTYTRPAYARALELIASEGAEVCHDGEIGRGIVNAVQKAGGLMSMEDLKGARARRSTP